MAEQDQVIHVNNDAGAVELLTSIKLYVTPAGGTEKEIGVALNANVSESRNVIYNYVIGNSTGTARDLIPGVIQNSTMRMRAIALYKKNILATLGSADGTAWLSSIRYQMKPFTIKEVTYDPSTSSPSALRTITYDGCVISDYGKTMDFTTNDIRILEDVTIHYKTVKVTQPSANKESDVAI